MSEHSHTYGRSACPHPDCVKNEIDKIEVPTMVFAFGRNPSTDRDLDHQLDVYAPLAIVSTFKAAQAGIIKYFRLYNSIGAEGEDNLDLDEDEQAERDRELSDDAVDLKNFTAQVEEMTFVGSTDGNCACFTDSHDDYWWIQSYQVDLIPDWEQE